MQFRGKGFLVLAYLLIASSYSALRSEEPTIAKLAHIRLSGAMGESPVPAEPLFGSLENFKSKIDRIRKAGKDDSIKGLYLHIDSPSLGWGKLDELSQAIKDFRKTGKKVFAYMEMAELRDYLLALACDEICLPPQGWLVVTGVSMQMSFYKDLLEKIGIEADFLQMGDFKAAAEPFTRNKMSEANRKQMESMLEDFFQKGVVERIVKDRPEKKWTPKDVAELIDKGPYTAKAAVEAGLIDRLAYPDEFQKSLEGKFPKNKVEIIKNYGQKKTDDVDFSNPFAILKLLAPIKITTSTKPKVAVIYAVGAINTGRSGESLMGGEVCGSTTIVEAIRKAEGDKTVKAIVIRVDSPGGSAVASDLIWNALIGCKKPVIASMSDVAASGGYYISMPARKIFAEPGTITGSIGVIGGKLAMAKLYDKIGISTETLSRGKNAGLLTSNKPWTATERASMQALMEDCYDQFLAKALEGRRKAGKTMTREQLTALAGGRVWTGRQALANGLIDELGTLDDAISAAWKLAGQPAEQEPELLILPKSKSFIDSLLDSAADAQFHQAEIHLLGLIRDFPALRYHLQTVGALLQLRQEPVWLMLPFGITVR